MSLPLHTLTSVTAEKRLLITKEWSFWLRYWVNPSIPDGCVYSWSTPVFRMTFSDANIISLGQFSSKTSCKFHLPIVDVVYGHIRVFLMVLRQFKVGRQPDWAFKIYMSVVKRATFSAIPESSQSHLFSQINITRKSLKVLLFPSQIRYS